MNEFEITPESMRAELTALDAERKALDSELLQLMDSREADTITEEEFDAAETSIGERGDKLNKTIFELLLALGDMDSIQSRLVAYADSIAEEMGEGMPISSSEMLMSTFGIYGPDSIPAEVEGIITALSAQYPILSDDIAAEDEHIKADPDWKPSEK